MPLADLEESLSSRNIIATVAIQEDEATEPLLQKILRQA
jgi:hypothetical protein